jgi:hypothetical protein
MSTSSSCTTRPLPQSRLHHFELEVRD